ncbi:hypothetical protein NDU88_008026 [Pleurodeles waltl]|uniref:Uncharacterized protein n=1 Tax=Pleurodeles waltl TaxID=8319 RepID=A0AAV7VRD6_PLEWA|nr:hypothetical protein NDU88_008026 [Pleurodeles waltl]
MGVRNVSHLASCNSVGWVSSTTPTSSSDWHLSRALVGGVSRSHDNVGTTTDAWDSDFRVPGIEKKDGHRSEGEKLPSASTATEEDREEESEMETNTEEDGAVNKRITGTCRESATLSGSRETSTFCHAPRGTWLNKVWSLFQGRCNPVQIQGRRGEGSEARGEASEEGT